MIWQIIFDAFVAGAIIFAAAFIFSWARHT